MIYQSAVGLQYLHNIEGMRRPVAGVLAELQVEYNFSIVWDVPQSSVHEKEALFLAYVVLPRRSGGI
jgi:hypothetical protein